MVLSCQTLYYSALQCAAGFAYIESNYTAARALLCMRTSVGGDSHPVVGNFIVFSSPSSMVIVVIIAIITTIAIIALNAIISMTLILIFIHKSLNQLPRHLRVCTIVAKAAFRMRVICGNGLLLASPMEDA